MSALSQKPKIEPLGSGVQDDCNHVGALSQKAKG
jgi:hypothetical protein